MVISVTSTSGSEPVESKDAERINVKITERVSQKAILDAEKIFSTNYNNEQFLKKLSKYHFFVKTLDSGKKIAQKIRQDSSEIKIDVEDRFGECTIAATDLKTKTITFNPSNADYPSGASKEDKAVILQARVRTLMHEYIHTLGYTHIGNGNNAFNRKSAPYKVANIFITHLSNQEIL